MIPGSISPPLLLGVPAAGFSNTHITLPYSDNWVGLQHNGAIFLGIANSSNKAATSANGLSWTGQTMTDTAAWNALGVKGSTFCATARDPDNLSSVSTNGSSWTSYPTTPLETQFGAMAASGSIFCGVGPSGTAAGTSPSGVTWTAQTLPASASWDAIAHNGTIFCAIAYGGTNAAISSDGATWSLEVLPASESWIGIAAKGSLFCAIAESGAVAVSTNGIAWTLGSAPVIGGSYSAIASNGSVFCIIDYNGSYASFSSDGLSWDQHALTGPSFSNIFPFASDGHSFVGLDTGTDQGIFITPP